jgi:hypothetical protein
MLTPICGPLRHGIDALLDALTPPSFRARSTFQQSSIKSGQQVYFGRNNVVPSGQAIKSVYVSLVAGGLRLRGDPHLHPRGVGLQHLLQELDEAGPVSPRAIPCVPGLFHHAGASSPIRGSSVPCARFP